MLGRNHFQRGAMLTTLGIFVAIITTMVVVAIPMVRHTRATNHAETCTENLAKLWMMKERYVLDHELKHGAKVELGDLLKGEKPLLKEVPVCPDGGTYVLGPVGVLPSCSFGHALPMAAQSAKQPPAAAAAETTTATASGK